MIVSRLLSFIMNINYIINLINADFKITSTAPEYLIKTAGCEIKQYKLNFKDGPPVRTCGKRGIFVKQISENTIQFSMGNDYRDFESCDYRFIYRSEESYLEDHNITYSPRSRFVHDTIVRLESDFIRVECRNKTHTVYDDMYAFFKKIYRQMKSTRYNKSWNVLLIGLDTVSRTRAYNSLGKTVEWLQKGNWLDFRGYNKVAASTTPNLMTVIMGRTLLSGLPRDRICKTEPSRCSDMMIWHKFQEAGYVTAYSEDAIYMKGSFQSKRGFKVPPTDHYLRPLFLAGEKKYANGLVCTKQISSGQLTLDYIQDFTETYRYNRFFGLFWIASYSHDVNQKPKAFDRPLKEFFEKINTSGVLENTFIFFFSDHGLRYGVTTKRIEAFYDDRLPMLFIWAPESFRKYYPNQYSNLRSHQQQLLSTFDLHLTLLHIFNKSKNFSLSPRLRNCPRCSTLFNKIPAKRNCADAGIQAQFCSCHGLAKTSLSESGAKHSLIKATKYMHRLSRTIATSPCTTCRELFYKNFLRVHSFSYSKSKYYVVAFTMKTTHTKAKEITFEATVLKTRINGTYTYELQTTKTLSEQKNIGYCALEPEERNFCICQKKTNCTDALLAKLTKNRKKKP